MDRNGKKLGTVGEPGELTNPVLSPDGKRVLLNIRDPSIKTRDIWIEDLARGTGSRFTFDPGEDYNPAWSPDGAYVYFSSDRKGHKDIYRKRADGAGAEEEVLVSGTEKSVDSLSPDGKSLLYNGPLPGKRWCVWLLSLMGNRKPALIAGGSYLANHGQFSPNGRWIVYTSEESGRSQIYVQSMPVSGAPAGKWQVSTNGGLRPAWRRDGKELFFENGDDIMAAPVRTDGASFESGAPVLLFKIRPGLSGRNDFTATADGQRFLVACRRDSSGDNEFHILLNWPALLKKN